MTNRSESGSETVVPLLDDLDLPDEGNLASLPANFLDSDEDTDFDTQVEFFVVPDALRDTGQPAVEVLVSDAIELSGDEQSAEFELADLIVDIDHDFGEDIAIFPELEPNSAQPEIADNGLPPANDQPSLMLALNLDAPAAMIVIDDEPDTDSVAF